MAPRGTYICFNPRRLPGWTTFPREFPRTEAVLRGRPLSDAARFAAVWESYTGCELGIVLILDFSNACEHYVSPRMRCMLAAIKDGKIGSLSYPCESKSLSYERFCSREKGGIEKQKHDNCHLGKDMMLLGEVNMWGISNRQHRKRIRS